MGTNIHLQPLYFSKQKQTRAPFLPLKHINDINVIRPCFFRDGFLGIAVFYLHLANAPPKSPPKEGTELTPWSEVSSPGESPLSRTVESSLVVVGKGEKGRDFFLKPTKKAEKKPAYNIISGIVGWFLMGVFVVHQCIYFNKMLAW